jgi:hypothetical protein
MSSKTRTNALDALRIDLANALGFPAQYTATAEPYLNYITNHFVAEPKPEDHLKLVIHILKHFRARGDEYLTPLRNVQGLIDDLASSSQTYFADTMVGSKARRNVVEDTILYNIGVFTLLRTSFVTLPVFDGARKIALAYSVRAQANFGTPASYPYEDTIAGLIVGSGVLPTAGQWEPPGSSQDEAARMKAAIQLMTMLKTPGGAAAGAGTTSTGLAHSLQKLGHADGTASRTSLRFLDDLDALESLQIEATRLNAYTLKVFGLVNIVWTNNISRHLLLRKKTGRFVLEVFTLPCALGATTFTSGRIGITREYTQEIEDSYGNLFNAWPRTPLHAKLGKFIYLRKLCWCWSCSACRYREQLISDYRKISQQRVQSGKESVSSHASEFDPRLIELMKTEPSDWTPEQFPLLWSRIMTLDEQAAKPWNIWILFRDRRDTLQFWTFL